MDARLTCMQFLQQQPMLAELDSEQLTQLMDQSQQLQLSKGTRFHQQDTALQHTGVVVSGRLKLFRLLQTGQEKVFRLLEPGDLMGETVLYLPGNRYNWTAQAIEDCELLLFPLNLFRQLLESNTALSIKLAQRLAGLEKDSMAALELLSLNKSMHRVIRYLLTQTLDDCGDCQALQFELPAPKRLIASQLSMQPETLSRMLHQLEQAGILQIDGRKLCVLDLPALLNHQF